MKSMIKELWQETNRPLIWSIVFIIFAILDMIWLGINEFTFVFVFMSGWNWGHWVHGPTKSELKERKRIDLYLQLRKLRREE